MNHSCLQLGVGFDYRSVGLEYSVQINGAFRHLSYSDEQGRSNVQSYVSTRVGLLAFAPVLQTKVSTDGLRLPFLIKDCVPTP